MLNDVFILTQIKEGNIKAFETLFRQYYTPLRLYAASITGEPDVAEEIVEEEIAEEETVEEIEEAEAAEAPAEEEIVEEVEETEEIIEEAAEEEFSAELEIMIAGEADELFYGDAVTLEAVVFGANMEYVVRWEAAGEDGEWFAVAEGSNVYEFVLTEETAAMQYRAVLVAVEL